MNDNSFATPRLQDFLAALPDRTLNDVFSAVEWGTRHASIKDETGAVIYTQEVTAPKAWSDLAVNIVASKYFTGSLALGQCENSVRTLITRVAQTIAGQLPTLAPIVSQSSLRTRFAAALGELLLHQKMAFNSPVWFNVGVNEHPQCSACFINSVEDSMASIMDLAKTEAMLFKGGSGTGTNLSPLRSSKEELNGGGIASGPVSFMRGFDAFAGVIKSGGKTRRAAKMVMLNVDHPDILEFINCKAEEEKKAGVMIDAGYDAIEAYSSVAFQNANHSIRVSDAFMVSALGGYSWDLKARRDGRTVTTVQARDVLMAAAAAAHASGDPGMMFDDTCNDWHTSAADGRINASNPCAEFVYLDDTACNLASLNLLKFVGPVVSREFLVDEFVQAVRLTILAQELLVGMSSYPTPQITANSIKFRPLGLGYANLGALLMRSGFAYDSDEGREIAANITSLMTAAAYAMSAQLASYFGAAAGFDKNQQHMTKVISKHASSSRLLDHPEATSKLHQIANALWAECETASAVQGFRNMQVTVLAPTGTIAFMMDCDTTGIEPDIALVKYKRLAGGGTLKIANNSVAAALITLGYARADVLAGILKHIELTGSIEGAPGFSPADLPVFDCAFASTPNGRSIAPLGHVKMMVAVQPFLSGAISKTVNVPEEATVQDIFDIYTRAWEGELKAIAVYRNNCKRMQPLQTKADNDKRLKTATPAVASVPVPELEPTLMVISEPAPVAQALGRRRLPRTRASVTHKFTLAGHEGYLTVGKFPDGTPGELFITMNKEGSTISGLMDTIAKLVSMALQHNIPLRDMARNFIDMRFEPAGFTGLREIPSATSIVDYIFRWMELEFARPIEADADGSLPKPEAVAPGGGPPCHVCGGLTTRSGSCHVCTSCGTTSGCS